MGKDCFVSGSKAASDHLDGSVFCLVNDGVRAALINTVLKSLCESDANRGVQSTGSTEGSGIALAFDLMPIVR